jgi:hypothetical protein
VFYVYGNRDPVTGNNRLAVRRLSDDKHGGLAIRRKSSSPGKCRPPFRLWRSPRTTSSASSITHVTASRSTDLRFLRLISASAPTKGIVYNTLETFLSPATDDGDPRQRTLGDYMQKAVGNTFFGFIGNGVPLGRSISSNHPIFYKVRL